MTQSAINISQLRHSAGAACATLRLLANEDRLMLLCQISQGEKNVSTLEFLTGIRQPTLSQQLGVLRTEGVVSTRREGKQIFYSLSDPHIEDLLQTLYNLYCCENCQS
jgi:ArsR family transcriptional regulator